MCLTVSFNSVNCRGVNNVLTHMTLNELAAHAAAALADIDQASGRVSEVPSVRTIRFYATHGLLDKPLAFKGRTAIYGPRHLHQLVAIKRLQARGLTLDEIQARVTGATDKQLATLSELELNTVKSKPDPVRSNFWAEVPEDDVPEPTMARTEVGVGAVRLDSVAVLLIDPLARELHPDDLEAIRVAAGPLLTLLHRRNLIEPRHVAAPREEEP